jgi:hypothetical protein
MRVTGNGIQQVDVIELRSREEAAKRINDSLGPDDLHGTALELLQMIYRKSNFDITFRKEAAEKAAPFETATKSEVAQTYVATMPPELLGETQVEKLAAWKAKYARGDAQSDDPADRNRLM